MAGANTETPAHDGSPNAELGFDVSGIIGHFANYHKTSQTCPNLFGDLVASCFFLDDGEGGGVGSPLMERVPS